MTTTSIEITYLFDDGRRVALGTGTIDAAGHIDITTPASGQEAYIAAEMAELNARSYVILKEIPTDPDLPQFALSKRKVYRGDPAFLSALKDYGQRVYAMDFSFDIEALQPPAPRLTELPAEEAPQPEADISPLQPGPDPAPDTGPVARKKRSTA